MDKSRLISYNVILLLALHLSPFVLYRNLSIILLGTLIVFDKNIWVKTKKLIKNKSFWVLIIPFFAYAFGLLYTDNFSSGLNEIEKKASLFLFPVIFGLTKIKPKDFVVVLKFFVLLISILPIIGFIVQWDIYISTQDAGWFYNDNLISIYNKQAVYYALFINTAILILINLRENGHINTLLQKWVSIFSFLLLISAQFLLASRTSMITTALIIIAYLSWLAITSLNRKKIALLVIGLTIGVLILILASPQVLNRYKSISNIEFSYDNPNPINHFNGEIKKENWNGLNTRLAIWSCAWEEFLKAPILGYGAGSVQTQLVQNYQEKKFILALNANYNTHNQYLDLLLTSGLLGLFLLVFFLIAVIQNSINKKNYLLIAILITFVFSSFTENILNRDQGVVFFAFLIAFLFNNPEADQKDSFVE